MKFSYKAIDDVGTVVAGTLEAENREAVYLALAERGLLPTEVASGESFLRGYLQRLELALERIRPVDLIFFTKQFRTLFKAGIAVVEALRILEFQTQNGKLKRVVAQMGEEISAGGSLGDAFASHPSVFSPLYISMIRAGEASGSLAGVLERLVYIMDHEHRIKARINSAMQYPKIVVGALVAAFLFLLSFVVPAFASIFAGANLTLPLPTRMAMALHAILLQWWMVSLPLILLLLAGVYWYQQTPAGRLRRDRLFLALPIMGPVFCKAAMSRFASIFAILQMSGIGVLDSMRIISDSIGNSAISHEFDKIGDKLREGRGISDPLRSAKYFTPMVINMVAVGEESGRLEEMLQDISDHYDDEVEYEVGRMTELLGPLLIVALAAVVGFFALAIFMPMWDMVQTVG
ncbi:MAG TPA: type II secretion system F family protein [Desulfurivibrio alkaliphilus]|uniref:Type II secretion system F family protein n=1 Tax=Desulfurivibrio alkaliphilus TaxID=427923 RepID=A0A7C2TJW8_9BACT|nr:type II secretion system F family protein [Desulfurivibrio alkaliphilus]